MASKLLCACELWHNVNILKIITIRKLSCILGTVIWAWALPRRRGEGFWVRGKHQFACGSSSLLWLLLYQPACCCKCTHLLPNANFHLTWLFPKLHNFDIWAQEPGRVWPTLNQVERVIFYDTFLGHFLYTFLWPLSIIFDILEPPDFQNYSTWWVFSELYLAVQSCTPLYLALPGST